MIKKISSMIVRIFCLPQYTDGLLNLSLAMLALGGLVMIVSTSLGSSVGDVHTFFWGNVKQAAYLLMAYFVMVFFSHVFAYKRWRILGSLILAAYLGIMLFTCLSAPVINGSKAWLYYGGFSLQPSEFGKPLSIFACAYAVHQARENPYRQSGLIRMFRIPLLFILCNSLLLVWQKDFGSLVIFLGISTLCLLVPSYKKIRKGQWVLRGLLLLGIAAGCLMISNDSINALMRHVPGISHIAIRISNMKDPYADLDVGYQPANALYGLAEAGIFGEGLGNSTRKYGYLSAANSDYIFAITIEETGWIGLIWIFGWYILLWQRLLHYALCSASMADKTLLCAVTGYFMLHFFINIGGVSTLIPMTGVPLLLFSAGGSALLACSMAMGAAQSRISRILQVQARQQKRLLARKQEEQQQSLLNS